MFQPVLGRGSGPTPNLKRSLGWRDGGEGWKDSRVCTHFSSLTYTHNMTLLCSQTRSDSPSISAICLHFVFQVQKGPVLLPTLNLPLDLSEQQQVLTVNLKPSTVLFSGSQSRPAKDHTPKTAVPVKGILKKTCSEDGSFKERLRSTSIPTGQTLVQNGQRPEKNTLITAGEYSPAPRSTAPWRQRTRKDATASSQRSRRPVSMTEEYLSTLQNTIDRYDSSVDTPINYRNYSVYNNI